MDWAAGDVGDDNQGANMSSEEVEAVKRRHVGTKLTEQQAAAVAAECRRMIRNSQRVEQVLLAQSWLDNRDRIAECSPTTEEQTE